MLFNREPSRTDACHIYIENLKHGGNIVPVEYLTDMRQKTNSFDAVLTIKGAYRANKERSDTEYLVLTYGSKDEPCKRVNVLGYADITKGTIYIYSSQKELARACIPGFLRTRLFLNAENDLILKPSDAALISGIDTRYIFFIDDPTGEELENVTCINSTRNSHDAIKNGIFTF